ncbi:hypothetical protein DSO57_1037131 [Entomophthora muscae]|uniref:Uncharacterized protein n=1 Tax=Entomophthora muscae TaxID=34485 RepID=A0ACC2S162_9FUNG|nr:hypothetical protein DSO57_1037131 [Entomophthora muscae]
MLFIPSQDLDSVALKGGELIPSRCLSGRIPRLHDTLKSCLISDSLALQDIGLQVTTLIFDAPVGAKLMRGQLRFSGQSHGYASVRSNQVRLVFCFLMPRIYGFATGTCALARNPSSDIKGPAFALCCHRAYHPFGVELTGLASSNSPPVVSFLLDRGADSTMLGQKWKCGVIESLSRRILTLKDTSGCEDICSPELQRQFSKYVREGVVYSDSTPSVALESS